MMHRALGIDLCFEAAGAESQLSALDDVEVVVGGVSAGVAFGANGCAEYD